MHDSESGNAQCFQKVHRREDKNIIEEGVLGEFNEPRTAIE